MTKKQLEEKLKEKNELLRKLSGSLRSFSCLLLELDQLILFDSLGDALEKKSRGKI